MGTAEQKEFCLGSNRFFQPVKIKPPLVVIFMQADFDDIAPGVALSTRTTVSKSVRALKIRAKLASIPGLRWLAMKSEA